MSRFQIDAYAVQRFQNWEDVVCMLVEAEPHLRHARGGHAGCTKCTWCETVKSSELDLLRQRRPFAAAPEVSCDGCILACLD